MVLTAFFRCPCCGETREYSSSDLDPHGWYSGELFDFRCKACRAELSLEVDYEFEFFESLLVDENDDFVDDIYRYSIEDARKQYERENPPRKFGLGSRFSLGAPKQQFSLTSGRFSLGNRKPHGKSLLNCKNKRDEK